MFKAHLEIAAISIIPGLTVFREISKFPALSHFTVFDRSFFSRHRINAASSQPTTPTNGLQSIPSMSGRNRTTVAIEQIIIPARVVFKRHRTLLYGCP